MLQNPALLDCAILTNETQVAGIEHEWRALQLRAGKSFFTDYDWFHIWWRTLGNAYGRSLHIVTARKDGRLVGVLPLCVIPKKGFRVLQAIGAEAFYFCDVLCEEPHYADRLWKAAKQSNRYDFAHIRDVMPQSAVEKTLPTFATKRECPKTLSLRLHWKNSDEWKASLPGDFRRNHIRRVRNLNQVGAVNYNLCEAPPVNTKIIEMLVENKTTWANQTGHQGMFDQPRVLDYWRQMAEQGAKDKTLLLAWITCGDVIITQNIMFKRGKTLNIHSLAVDPAWGKYAPGHMAIINAISWAIDNDYEVVEHRQGESDLKAKFSNQGLECPEYSFHRSLKGWLGETLFFTRRELRQRNIKSPSITIPKIVEHPIPEIAVA